MKRSLLCLTLSLTFITACGPTDTTPGTAPTPTPTAEPTPTPVPSPSAPAFQGETTLKGSVDLDILAATVEASTASGSFRKAVGLVQKQFEIPKVPVGERVRVQVQYRNNPRVVLSALSDVAIAQKDQDTVLNVNSTTTATDLIYQRAATTGKASIVNTPISTFESNTVVTGFRNEVVLAINSILATPVDAIQVTIPTAPSVLAKIDEILPKIEAALANQPIPSSAPTTAPTASPTTAPTASPTTAPGIFTPTRLLVKPGNNVTIARDTTLKLWAKGVDAQNRQEVVTPVWVPGNNAGSASIDSAGNFAASAPGTYTFNATLGNLKETITITVTEGDLESVEIVPENNFTLDAGRTFELQAKGKDERANEVTVTPTWELSNTVVGTVDANGVFTAKQAGKVDVTARAKGFVSTITITVESGSNFAIEAFPESPVILKGRNQVIQALALELSGGSNPFAFNFSVADSNVGGFISADSSINGINPSAVFQAKNVGTTSVTIRDTVSGKTVTLPVTVADNVPYISNLSPNAPVVPGQTVTLVGENFSQIPSENQVFFNNIPGSVVSSTSTSLTVTVPIGSVTGFASVSTNGAKGNAIPFTINPVLNNLIPNEAEEGSIITLTGQNFSSLNPAHNVVFFGGERATVPVNVTNSSLQVIVPANLTSEVDVTVRVKGQLSNVRQFNATGASIPTWTERQNATVTRSGADAEIIDGNLYVVGGYQSGSSDTLEFYDISGNNWSTKAQLPSNRTDFATAVENDRLYVIGGSGSSAAVHRYSPGTNTWTSLASLNFGRSGLVAETYNGRIYAIGGDGSDGRVVEEYDPGTNKWTQKRNSPSRRYQAASAFLNGKIYVIGGGENGAEDRVTYYDPEEDEWTTALAPLPRAVTKASAVVINNKIYVIGGEDNNGNPVSSVYEYDSVRDSWRTMKDLPSARSGAAITSISSRIYVVGGENGSGSNTNTLFRGNL